jgi:hypothetical protein
MRQDLHLAERYAAICGFAQPSWAGTFKEAARARAVLTGTSNLVEKKMFGGIGYLAKANMACGVYQEDLIVHVGPQRYQVALNDPFTRVFDITGRAMTVWGMIRLIISCQAFSRQTLIWETFFSG